MGLPADNPRCVSELRARGVELTQFDGKVFKADGAFTDESLRLVLGLPGLSALYVSDDESGAISDEGLQTLAGLPLTNLKLFTRQTSASGLRVLRQLETLVRLELPMQSGDDSLPYLQPLVRLDGLTLNNTQITGSGFAQLAHLAQMTNVQLITTPVDDAGLEQIARLPKLGLLCLAETKVTDEGLRHLVGKPSLRTLTLEGTAISDAAWQWFAQMPRLTTLDVTHTNVSAQAAEAFRRARPGVEVHVSVG